MIHVPLALYSDFLQPILRVLLQQSPGAGSSSPDKSLLEGLTSDGQHGFLNISVTPVECSIVCHSAWAKSVFEPAIARLPQDDSKTVSVSGDSYAVVSVISAGMDASSRVVDLTSPLALAGVPVFFITTYYSDFILVPTKDRHGVVKALIARGFVFSEDESAFRSAGPLSASAPHSRQNSGGSSSSRSEPPIPPSTPPPSSIREVQARAFQTLEKRSVVPYLEPDLRLIHCSGRERSSIRGYSDRPSFGRTQAGRAARKSWVDKVDSKLYTCIVSALVSQPRFLSITLAQDDPPSLLLDRDLLRVFGDSLVGPTEGDLVPILLNLDDLPFKATGIVSGVAGKLVQVMGMTECAELSYLSTARAGAVILPAEQAVRALEVLKSSLAKEG